MNKLASHSKNNSYILAGIVLFMAITLLSIHTGYYNFCYLEQWNTFIYNANYQKSILAQPGRCVQLLSSFLIQFFTRPLTGILTTALLLTGAAVLTADILYSWTKNKLTLPLALFPAAALFFLHHNVNCQYAGTVAFLWMLLFLRLQLLFRKFPIRFAYSLASTLLLFAAAGPIAFLYSWLILIIELSCYKKQALWFASLPLMAYLAAKVCLWFGLSGELRHVLLPDGYFTLRLQPGSIIYLPWGLVLAVFLASGLCKSLRLKNRGMQKALIAAQLVCAAAFTFDGISRYIDRNNEIFKELNHYARHSQWSKIIDRCENISMNNLLFQNYHNVALAEQGMLSDQLFMQPCIDIQTIYVPGNKTPYISALLSDIYFSMGHIAFSQRYAFEANEGMDNFSPRMLQRLVQTNLIYEHYGTAKKYLDILESTLFYKDWATTHRRFLWNDPAVEADSILGSKRKCLFPDNRFSGIKGLDDDLKQIILKNPMHKTTIQYLGSLYLLSKDIPRFKATLETFYGTPALPSVLPVCFQEGVVAFAAGDREILERYNIQTSTIERFDVFKQRPSTDTRNLWYFLKYTN